MDAIQLKFSADIQNKYNKVPVLDPVLCLGCGVCVHKCPTQSILLERREETTEPPKNAGEYIGIYMGDRLAAMQDGKQQ